MAVTFEELVGSVKTTGTSKAKREVEDVRGSFHTLGQAIESLGTLGGITFLFSQLQELGRTLGTITGVGIAARFQGIARALEAVTGSADKANHLLKQFKEIGRESAFDTADIAAMGARMLGAGVTAERVNPELRALVDLASHGMGIDRSDLPEFMRNLLQIRGRGTGKADLADINQLKDRVPQIGKFLAAGIGGKVSTDDALKQAQGMTGRELYDTIIKGSQAMAQGAAKAKALLDPMAALGNVFETLNMAMEPTGKILLPIVMEFIRFGQALADVAKFINDATFGLSGLTAVVGGGLFAAATITTLALTRLAAAMAAVSAVAGAGLAGTIATVAAPIIPVVLGALAVLGIGKYLWDKVFPGKGAGAGKPTTDPVVAEQKKTNQILENIHATQRGGGPRTAAAMSNYVAELQLQRWLAF